MWIHNITEQEKIYQGRPISPGQFFNIPANLLVEYQEDQDLILDLLNGEAKISLDGQVDYLGSGVQHLNVLKQIDTTQKDSDGAILSRVKVTQTGWNYQLIAVEIETSKTSGAYCKDIDGNSVPWFTYKMYDSNGQETQDEMNCVKTVIDFEPPFDYEILGGTLIQKVAPDSDMYYSVIGVPDIPSNMGGSKVFVQAVDLTFIGTDTELKTDGRAPKRLVYDTTYHTNKLRFQITHEAGKKHKFLQCLEYFRP